MLVQPIHDLQQVNRIQFSYMDYTGYDKRNLSKYHLFYGLLLVIRIKQLKTRRFPPRAKDEEHSGSKRF